MADINLVNINQLPPTTTNADVDVAVDVPGIGLRKMKRSDLVGAGLVAMLENIGDVPPYPDDGQQWKLIEKDGVLSWIVDVGGSGGVPEAPIDTKVYGRKDGDWEEVVAGGGDGIPLSGTEAGKPVTGLIKLSETATIEDVNDTNNVITFNYYYQSGVFIRGAKIDLSGGDGGLILESTSATLQGSKSRLLLNSSEYISVNRTNPNNNNFEGLRGDAYFGANYTDNSYVQRKYVDNTKMILKSPDGTEYKIEVDNSGVLSASQI